MSACLPGLGWKQNLNFGLFKSVFNSFLMISATIWQLDSLLRIQGNYLGMNCFTKHFWHCDKQPENNIFPLKAFFRCVVLMASRGAY